MTAWVTGNSGRSLSCAAIIAVAFAVISSPSARQGPAETLEPRDLLVRSGFSKREIADIDRELPVARVLNTDRREVAVIGAVKIRASSDRLLDRLRTIDYLKGSGNMLDVGQFGRTPNAADLQGLRFEDYDLDVRRCRPGDCRVRLSAADIARFHREVNWQSPEWKTESAAVWREVLGGYASAYLTVGPSSLPVYVNKKDPLEVEDERALLLAESGVMAAYAPELSAYLRDPASGQPRGLEELTYWSVEDFGIRPVVRVIHQMVYRPLRAGAPVVIATDQIYAAHYLDAAVGFAFAIDAPGDEGRAFYLVLTTRARTRSLTGLLRTMVRSTVRGRSRDGIAKMLTSTKRALEGRGSRSDPRGASAPATSSSRTPALSAQAPGRDPPPGR